MKNQKIEGIIRHIVSFAAGSAVLFGYLSTEAADSAQGIILMLTGAVLQGIAWYRSYITKQDDPTDTGTGTGTSTPTGIPPGRVVGKTYTD